MSLTHYLRPIVKKPEEREWKTDVDAPVICGDSEGEATFPKFQELVILVTFLRVNLTRIFQYIPPKTKNKLLCLEILSKNGVAQ